MDINYFDVLFTLLFFIVLFFVIAFIRRIIKFKK